MIFNLNLTFFQSLKPVLFLKRRFLNNAIHYHNIIMSEEDNACFDNYNFDIPPYGV